MRVCRASAMKRSLPFSFGLAPLHLTKKLAWNNLWMDKTRHDILRLSTQGLWTFLVPGQLCLWFLWKRSCYQRMWWRYIFTAIQHCSIVQLNQRPRPLHAGIGKGWQWTSSNITMSGNINDYTIITSVNIRLDKDRQGPIKTYQKGLKCRGFPEPAIWSLSLRWPFEVANWLKGSRDFVPWCQSFVAKLPNDSGWNRLVEAASNSKNFPDVWNWSDSIGAIWRSNSLIFRTYRNNQSTKWCEVPSMYTNITAWNRYLQIKCWKLLKWIERCLQSKCLAIFAECFGTAAVPKGSGQDCQDRLAAIAADCRMHPTCAVDRGYHVAAKVGIVTNN